MLSNTFTLPPYILEVRRTDVDVLPQMAGGRDEIAHSLIAVDGLLHGCENEIRDGLEPFDGGLITKLHPPIQIDVSVPRRMSHPQI